MDTIAATIITGITCALIGGYAGHRLRIGGEAHGRRRDFRFKLRSMARRIAEARNTSVVSVYEESCAEIKILHDQIIEDIWPVKRAGFTKAVETYYSINKDDLVPPRPGPEGITSEDTDKRIAKYQNSRDRLVGMIQSAIAAI